MGNTQKFVTVDEMNKLISELGDLFAELYHKNVEFNRGQVKTNDKVRELERKIIKLEKKGGHNNGK